jgi:hypothetical protein
MSICSCAKVVIGDVTGYPPGNITRSGGLSVCHGGQESQDWLEKNVSRSGSSVLKASALLLLAASRMAAACMGRDSQLLHSGHMDMETKAV